VFQFPEYQLFEETVFKDIAYGVSKLGLDEAELGRRVRAAADAVGIPESLMGKSPFELSGGQKRRVAIAGVLVMEPRYLVMDEPASGLDPAGRQEILGYAARLHRERGVTAVLVSHNMEDVAQYAERVLVMEDGRVAMDGPPGEVFQRVEELERLGLRPPDVSYLLRALAPSFPGIDLGAVTAEAAADEIERALRAAGVDPAAPAPCEAAGAMGREASPADAPGAGQAAGRDAPQAAGREAERGEGGAA